MDTVSPNKRSEIMGRVRSKDTKPEMFVRRLIYGMGYRYRLHIRELPGRPDIVFRKKRKVIFVHGCFWHKHNCKKGKRMPKSRVDFWRDKLMKNKKRDMSNQKKLSKLCWKYIVIWECELQNIEKLKLKTRDFLDEG